MLQISPNAPVSRPAERAPLTWPAPQAEKAEKLRPVREQAEAMIQVREAPSALSGAITRPVYLYI
jgi:hypothetical protein